MSNNSVPGRRNGFSAPYSTPQLMAWLVLAVTIVQFLFFVSPMLPIAASIPVTVFFFALIGGIIYYGGLTQAIDPMDPHLRVHLHNARPDDEAKLSKLFYRRFNPLPQPPLPEEPMKQCWICDIQVAEPSLHCKYCGKCVKNFDHHCLWLNTCIGKDNYRHFFATMVVSSAMQIAHIAIQVGLLVDSWTGGTTLDRANAWFNANAAPAVRGVWIFFIAFDILSLFLLGQLIWFHLMLQRKNLTTYAYIVQEAAKRREKMRHDQEVAAHRSGAVLKANHEGRTVDSMKLHVGRICRASGCESCDPLVVPERLAKGASSDAAEFGANFGNALSQSDSQPGLESPSLVGGSDSSAAAEDAFVPDPGVRFVKVKQQNPEQMEAAVTSIQEGESKQEQPTPAPVS